MDQLQGAFSNFLLSTGLDIPTFIGTIVTTITFICLLTRLISGNEGQKASGVGKGSRPPMIPYWIPYFGHSLPLLYDKESVLKSARESSPRGIFALKLGRQRHNILYSAPLIKRLLYLDNGAISEESFRLQIMRNAFGLPSKQASLYQSIIPQLDATILPHLRLSDVSNDTRAKTLRHLQGNLPDFVTFNPSMVDQEPWERLSGLQSTNDNEGVEASLLPLVFIFLTHMTTDSLITESILSDSDHHEIPPLLLSFMQSFSLLLTGLPRLMPHPSLPSAHITRRRLLQHLSALTSEVLEDPEMQGPLLEARQAVLDEDQVPQNVRTADLLALLWSINMPNVLAFWVLVHVISNPKLLEKIREETSKYVKAVQEQAIMGFSVPPRVSIDPEGLLYKCPLLKSSYIETVRLYSRGLRAGTVSQDVDLGGEEDKIFKAGERWALSKGDWFETSYWLCNTDPANFADEQKWDSARHVVAAENGEQTSEWGTVFSDYGVIGSAETKDQCEMICLAFIAGTIALWDFEPVNSKSWIIPTAQFAVGVALPSGDFRATIKKRVLPPAQKLGGKA